MSAVPPVQAAGVPAISKGPEGTGVATQSRTAGTRPVAFDAGFGAGVETSAASGAAGGSAGKVGEADNPYAKFEAMVVSQLVSTMLSSSGDGMFGKDGDMQAFASIFAGAIGDEMVKHGGLGLTEKLAHAGTKPSGQ